MPKAIWKCQEPSSTAKSQLEVPKALWQRQKPSGSAKNPLEGAKPFREPPRDQPPASEPQVASAGYAKRKQFRMSETSGADLGVPWPRRGPPGSPGAPGHEKGTGKKLVTVPGPDSAVLGAGRSKKPPKIFRKMCEISRFRDGPGK